MGELEVRLNRAVDAFAEDGRSCPVPAGKYKIVPVVDSVRDGQQVVVLEDSGGKRLPPLTTRTRAGRTALGRELVVEPGEGWDDTRHQLASVELDAWR